ncbi:hypothetical protein F5884DRAFT_101350 [Xylogone sp. PMI_703]|nr:hypothetical protein F5884DRAFT_101350 [Xylogone sp. PMI_703]
MATPAQLAEKEALRNRTRSPSPSVQEAAPARYAPPLPPRAASNPDVPPPYATHDPREDGLIQPSADPRLLSTQSLVPLETHQDGRRKLLLVYIHGFLGKEASFQHFPAHIHNILSITLAETHVVHTKIYPRYKSRGAIEFASEDFINWLELHEDEMIDVILLGHSMGGLLTAEIVLRAQSLEAGHVLQNCILGTISFDSPFLGMHPGVISSGIGSLFRSAPDSLRWDQQGSPQGEASSLNMPSQTSLTSADTVDTASNLSQFSSFSPLASPPDDPNFDPPFPNDIRIKERDGWNSMLHFIQKHSDGLASATKQYFMSHFEFGSCLADYPGLVDRYHRLRVLEDINEHTARYNASDHPRMKQVRFVNYYTVSTGRPKSPARERKGKDETPKSLGVGISEMSLSSTENRSSESISKIPIERSPSNATTPLKTADTPDISSIDETTQVLEDSEEEEIEELQEMVFLDPVPMEEDEPQNDLATETMLELQSTPQEHSLPASESQLPPIPDIPVEPSPIDLTLYQDKEHRKIAEKESKRQMKAYQQAVKDREHAIKDRRKLVEKREKKARQEREKQLKAEEKQLQKEMKELKKQEAAASQSQSASEASQTGKVKKEKKFCLLPMKVDGEIDKCWIRVYMEGVDEVGAHTELFLPGVHYETLVGDVTTRIEEWVREDATKRALHDAEIGSWD